MDPQRWRLVKDVFQEAIARGAPERHAFLSDACSGDASLRHDVERLLQATERFHMTRSSLSCSVSIRGPSPAW
jgi:serine/threonine-protein kinase